MFDQGQYKKQPAACDNGVPADNELLHKFGFIWEWASSSDHHHHPRPEIEQMRALCLASNNERTFAGIKPATVTK